MQGSTVSGFVLSPKNEAGLVIPTEKINEERNDEDKTTERKNELVSEPVSFRNEVSGEEE